MPVGIMRTRKFLLATTLLLLFFCQKVDNPLSSRYEGEYALSVAWPESDTLELFKEYNLSWTVKGETYRSITLSSSPEMNTCETVFKSEMSDSGSIIYLKSAGPVKLSLLGTRPNEKKDVYERRYTVVNPFWIEGSTLSSTGTAVEYRVSKFGNYGHSELKQVTWKYGSVSKTLAPDQPFTIVPDQRGTFTLSAIITSLHDDTMSLKPISISVPGSRPKIESVKADSIVNLGDSTHFGIRVSDIDGGAVKALIIRGQDSLVTQFTQCTNDTADINVAMNTSKRDSTVTIEILDESGLKSEVFTVKIPVIYFEPIVKFGTKTITAPLNKPVQVDVHSEHVQTFWWKSSSGSLDTLTDSNHLSLHFGETNPDTLILIGQDAFQYWSAPETLIVNWVNTEYNIVFDTIPEIAPMKVWLICKASLMKNGIRVDDAQFAWRFSDTNAVEIEQRGDTLAFFVKDSLKSLTVRAETIVEDSIQLSASGTVQVRPFLPRCNFKSEDSTAQIQIPQKFTVTYEPGHPQRPLGRLYYSLDNILTDSIVCSESGKSEIAFTFNKQGTSVIRAWVKDSAQLTSAVSQIQVTAKSDRPWFDPLSIDTATFIKDSFMLDFTVHVAAQQSDVQNYLFDYDGNGTWDKAGFVPSIKIGPFREAGNKMLLVAAVDSDQDTTPLPLRINVQVNEGKPVITDYSPMDVWVKDTIPVVVKSSDINGYIVKRWVDWDANGVWDDSLTQSNSGSHVSIDTFHHVWDTLFGGKIATYRVRVMDEDSIFSSVKVCSTLVRMGRPKVWVSNDTLFVPTQSSGGYVDIPVNSFDTNGTIQKYYWDFNAPFDTNIVNTDKRNDSIYSYNVQFPDMPFRMAVFVKDDDNLFGGDTFWLYPDAPPITPDTISPKKNQLISTDTVELVWKGEDKRDGINTQFSILLQDDISPTNIVLDYSQSNLISVENVGGVNHFRYRYAISYPKGSTIFWKVIAKDAFGRTSESAISFFRY